MRNIRLWLSESSFRYQERELRSGVFGAPTTAAAAGVPTALPFPQLILGEKKKDVILELPTTEHF